jgi:Na+/melibiose symporter-like transporter
MTAEPASLPNHPAPHRDQVSAFESVFGLLGGPGAWFAQLCAGYAMASWPCFPREEHRILPEAGYAWTWAAIVAVSVVAIGISFAAFAVSRRTYERVQSESQGSHQHLLDVGSGRTRFLALWGMVLGASFAVGTAMTLVAFFVLPRCAG